MTMDTDLIGIGLYTISEASALTGVPTAAIRRWLLGYKFQGRAGERAMEPVWTGDLLHVDGTVSLSFLDLMEVRFVHAFRRHHVSWPAIREAALRACQIYESPHPFSMRRFRTDGRRIFAEIEESDNVRMFDINKGQFVFQKIIERSLYEGIEFYHEQAVRWFPMFPKKQVVIDPDRAFGKPIIESAGVPVEILAKAAEAEGSVQAAARWYDVSVSSVRAAVEFQRRVAA